MEEEIKALEEVIDELEETTEKVEEELKGVNETLDEVEFFQNDLRELIKLTSLKELLLEIDKKTIKHSNSSYLFNNYLSLRYLLESSYTLHPVFLSEERIKDKNKVISQANDNNKFNKELKRATNKLNKNKFSFKEDFSSIYSSLLNYVEEQEARIFVYSLCRLINSNGNKFINTYSLFINQLLKNVTLLDGEFDFKEEFLDNIKKYYSDITN